MRSGAGCASLTTYSGHFPSSDNLGLSLPCRGGQSITQTPLLVPIITLLGINLSDSVYRTFPPVEPYLLSTQPPACTRYRRSTNGILYTGVPEAVTGSYAVSYHCFFMGITLQTGTNNHEALGEMSAKAYGKLPMEKQHARIEYRAHPCRGGDHEA
jgi:hypothetical protein